MNPAINIAITIMMTISICDNSAAMPTNSTNNVSDEELSNIIAPMVEHDRSNPCLMVATIGKQVKRAVVCANKHTAAKRVLNFDTAFEIGSISKTMTATVLAGLIRDEDLSLDDTLESILPKGRKAPTYNGEPILLKHLVTHSSGIPPLPAGMQTEDLTDPYAAVDQGMLLDSLAKVTLTKTPGSTFEYSNFAMMLLSLGLANISGKSFDELLTQYVFDPLDMQNAHTTDKPKGVTLAAGHNQLGQIVSHWGFSKNMHGVGGVRASLNDMVRYAQANLGLIKTPVNKLLSHTHKPLLQPSGQVMGMNWIRTTLGGKDIVMHEGGTGGFSALIILHQATETGVVILADTALTNTGGLSAIAMPLIDSSLPPAKPRLKQAAPSELLESLVGDYKLPEAELVMTLWQQDGNLYAKATGQKSFILNYDSHGDFYPSSFDALLRPTQNSQGQTFEWIQGGGVVSAKRINSESQQFKTTEEMLRDYVGRYPLMPSFSLKVESNNNTLTIQGSNQPSLSLTPVRKDEFSYDAAGAYFIFNRNEKGEVTSITIKQRGQTLHGDKQ